MPSVSTVVRKLFTLLAVPALAQTTLKQPKPTPPKIEKTLYVLLDSVVTEQWPALPPLVNIPTNITLLNPGQCIRAATLASGDGHEHLLNGATIAWTVRFAGKEDTMPAAAFATTKQIKPEGSDFVLGALQAAGIKQNPIVSFISMSAAASRWCVPQGASDGAIEIHAMVQRGDQVTQLPTVKLQAESLATAARKTFKDDKELGTFIQTYHIAPEPGRLLPAFQSLTKSKPDSLIPYAFFRAAFLHDAPTVQGFGPGLAASSKLTQILALNLMTKAGVKLLEPPPLDEADRNSIAEAADIPDPYDMKIDGNLFQKLDFLWADFSATGRPQPVKAVVSALAWRADYDAFDAMRKSGKKPGSLNDSLIRGLTFMVAGWSSNSFERTNPLAADYLLAIAADPATPAAIKIELGRLYTDPAFKRE